MRAILRLLALPGVRWGADRLLMFLRQESARLPIISRSFTRRPVMSRARRRDARRRIGKIFWNYVASMTSSAAFERRPGDQGFWCVTT
jgi:hypothetical protein